MMAENFPITIHHNPACGTSRNTLAMIRAAGYEPVVVEYLKTGWTVPQLERLLKAMGMTARDLLREKGTPAAELGLTAPDVDEATLLRKMVEHPILVNRPIVETPKGTRLTRPSELVLHLLDKRPGRFEKEDGQIVGG
jgi:arsenate reductase